MKRLQKLRDMLQLDIKAASTAAVHISLVLGVAVYTLFGALSMQYLESPERVRKERALESEQEKMTTVYLGSEVSEMDKGVHACLKYVLTGILDKTKCDEHELEHISIANIDSCYQFAKFDKLFKAKPTEPTTTKTVIETEIEKEVEEELEKWSFGNAIIFAFTVITTIGYGHVAPETFHGRLFCIFYGVIGVPLTLLTIADMGMFFSICLRHVTTFIEKIFHICFPTKKSKKLKRLLELEKSAKNPEIMVTDRDGVLETAREPSEFEDEKEEEEKEEGGRKTGESIALGVTFTFYLVLGAKVLSVYEPEMDFFKALYFNFVTLTTIGLGDFVPKSFDYLFVTLVYIGVGLALTTMAIEIAADLLKKVHYAGRKMENMASAVVWFGGKKMTMKNLVKHLGDKFNIPEEDLANFNMDQFVDNAMKVEAGEIKTLRKPQEVVFREPRAVSYSNLRKSSESEQIRYVDDRFSKTTVPEMVTIREDTTRTMDTLPVLHEASSVDGKDDNVPRLDLDFPVFTDSSLPTSFDEDYMRTMTFSRR